MPTPHPSVGLVPVSFCKALLPGPLSVFRMVRKKGRGKEGARERHALRSRLSSGWDLPLWL